MPAYVYVLTHREHPRIKIGKAKDILVRAASIGINEFSFEKSLGLEVPTERDALRIERHLHQAFDAWYGASLRFMESIPALEVPEHELTAAQ